MTFGELKKHDCRTSGVELFFKEHNKICNKICKTILLMNSRNFVDSQCVTFFKI
jgi:hypothetical protein